jgi:cytochrome c7-like protein
LQAKRILGYGVVIAAASLLLWEVFKAASPNRSLGAPERDAATPATTSGIFTPAHRTFGDAWRDFFYRRPEPVQPITYTHQVHLVKVGMQCTFCHVGVDTGPDARIPGVQVCMTCHQAVATDNPEIKKVAAFQARGEEIPWQRVYGFSPYAHVRFNHAPHIRASVDCKVCHGDMTQVTVARRSVDMTMGFCIDCHKSKGASIDCTTCHF